MSPETAPDGSPVAFYRRLPPTGEPETIAAIVPPGSTILELGCGAGRVAGPLEDAGLSFAGWRERPGWLLARPG